MNDVKEGEGNLSYLDKNRYIGGWKGKIFSTFQIKINEKIKLNKDDKRHGKGILITPDGSKYSGHFKVIFFFIILFLFFYLFIFIFIILFLIFIYYFYFYFLLFLFINFLARIKTWKRSSYRFHRKI